MSYGCTTRFFGDFEYVSIQYQMPRELRGRMHELVGRHTSICTGCEFEPLVLQCSFFATCLSCSCQGVGCAGVQTGRGLGTIWGVAEWHARNSCYPGRAGLNCTERVSISMDNRGVNDEPARRHELHGGRGGLELQKGGIAHKQVSHALSPSARSRSPPKAVERWHEGCVVE